MRPKRDGTHTAVISRKAPKPVGPYVQAVKTEAPGEMLYVSGQIPLDPLKGTAFTGDIKRQVQICMNAVKNIVEDAKFTMGDLVHCTIYVTNLDNFAAVNEAYGKYFQSTPPARSVVGAAALPKGVGVEISAVAVAKSSSGVAEDDWDSF